MQVLIRFIGFFCLIFFSVTPSLVHAYYDSDIERVFNWAESQFSDFFTPAAATQSAGDWRFRYYGDTGVYVGVNGEDDLYLLEAASGGMQYISPLCTILRQLAYSNDSQVITRVAAGTGQSAPGFPDGYVFWTVGKPGMGECGHIAFEGAADVSVNSTSSNTNAVWAGFPGNLQVIVKENDTISGLPATVLFEGGKFQGTVIDPPVVTSSGHVAFLGYLKGAVTTGTSAAILAWVDGSLQSVLRLGDPAPGFSDETLIYQINSFRFSDAGMVISGTTGDYQPALWYWDFKEVSLLAAGMKSQLEDVTEAAPFPIQGCDYGYFAATSMGTDYFINDNGDIVTDTILETTDSAADCPQYATVNMKNSSLEILAQADENFPLNNGDLFTRWTTKHLDPEGGVTLNAAMGGEISSWYKPADSDLRLVALTGETVPPDFTQSLINNILFPYAITNSSERSVVYGTAKEGSYYTAELILAGTPRTSLPYASTDDAGNSQLTLIAKTNNQPEEFPATSFFSDIGEPKLTEDGDILFSAAIESSTDGSTVQSIWRVAPDNAMSCIFKTGDQIDVDGDLKTVEEFYFDDENDTRWGIGSGMAGLFSDTEKLVVRCRFAGSSTYDIVTISYE